MFMPDALERIGERQLAPRQVWMRIPLQFQPHRFLPPFNPDLATHNPFHAIVNLSTYHTVMNSEGHAPDIAKPAGWPTTFLSRQTLLRPVNSNFNPLFHPRRQNPPAPSPSASRCPPHFPRESRPVISRKPPTRRSAPAPAIHRRWDTPADGCAGPPPIADGRPALSPDNTTGAALHFRADGLRRALAGRYRRGAQLLVVDFGHGFCIKNILAGQQIIPQRAERIDVAALVNFHVSVDGLRWREPRRAFDDIIAGRIAPPLASSPRYLAHEAEIQHLHAIRRRPRDDKGICSPA